MRVVMLDVPDSLLAERRSLGHDRFDEMWEGVLHMVPPPTLGHQGLGAELLAVWFPLAKAAGIRIFYEAGLFDPDVADFSSYRQPDLCIAEPAVTSKRGIEGAAHLAVEIRSPNDESFEKLPFYERVGVREVLIVDQPDAALYHWTNGPNGLVASTPAADGSLPLGCLPSSLLIVGDMLRVHHGDDVIDLPLAG